MAPTTRVKGNWLVLRVILRLRTRLQPCRISPESWQYMCTCLLQGALNNRRRETPVTCNGFSCELRGTSLFLRLQGVPAGSELTPVSQQWLDYCLQPERAKGLGAEKLGLSPLILPPFPESPIPGLPVQAQLASAGGGDWRMAIANRDDGSVTSERRQSGAEASIGPVESNEGRARFNGLYAPRMAVSAQVSGVGKGPFEKGVTSGQLPRLEVLEKSELLEPLDERGQAEFRWLLGLVEETETESLEERVKRKWGEVVEVGASARDVVRTKVHQWTDRLRALRAA